MVILRSSGVVFWFLTLNLVILVMLLLQLKVVGRALWL